MASVCVLDEIVGVHPHDERVRKLWGCEKLRLSVHPWICRSMWCDMDHWEVDRLQLHYVVCTLINLMRCEVTTEHDVTTTV